MGECLLLAEEGRGEVGNGAMVGALLVLENKIIAQGLHKGFGKAHAERDLLLHFPGTVPRDAILYVNLEPCCHVGKTPPCTDIILGKGVKRLCFGMRDPDERVCSRGEALLRGQGVQVIGPVARPSCEYFNRGFASLRKRHRPWIILKSARTPEGRSAAEDGSPLKITGEEQDRWAHTSLRSRVDAILVGVQTVISDDPRLDTRWSQNAAGRAGLQRYQPWRIILDSHLRTPLTARVVSDDNRARTVIITSPTLEAGKEDRRKELQGRGVQVWDVPVFNGSFDFPELWGVLSRPEGAFHGITSILVEGGARTWEVFREAGMVDEEVVMVGK
jgi:diaminohydroxyphosphoribosylaminopyrimidine deaminase/5-amino-6-(5-phosphoribosylamino)uracil reductase